MTEHRQEYRIHALPAVFLMESDEPEEAAIQ